MITAPGLYLVSVNESNNSTYLQGGLYRVYIAHPYANFRNVQTGGGTFERITLLKALEHQGRISITPVSPNREQLEADLVAFDAWRAA
jgi:hypothetical protein